MESDRTWPVPTRPFSMRMRWHEVLFTHWCFHPKDIDRLLPDGVRVDTFDGKAWIAVVPFRMTDVAPRQTPAIPWISAFPELNVRTYVTLQGKPGVWFFSLEASNPIAVRAARRCFHLPYMDAVMSTRERNGWVEYNSHRTHRGEPTADYVARYRPLGESFFAQVGTLEYWLTARYCLYASDRHGRILRGEIDHPPWPLHYAELETSKNTMLDWLSLSCDSNHHLLFSRDLRVVAWTNEQVS